MTDYTELVKALRHCGKDLMPGERCKDSCPYGDIALCLPKLKLDAAAAIEELQARLPKQGEWIEENRRPRSSQFVCSVCHRTAYDPQPTRDKAWRKRCRYAYCPNCGAKMEVQE